MLAARDGQLEVVTKLAQLGADLEEPDQVSLLADLSLVKFCISISMRGRLFTIVSLRPVTTAH